MRKLDKLNMMRRLFLGPRLMGARSPWYLSGSALADSLVGFWKLDEASGNAIATIGSTALTDNNTVTSAAGYSYPLAREFVIANSEYLSAADSATLSSGDIDMWGAFHARPAAVNVAQAVVCKFNTTGNQREWQIAFINTDVTLTVSPDGTSTGTGAVTAAGVLAANTWVTVMWYHDATNNLIGLSINGGAFATAAHTTGIFDSTALLNVGRQSTGVAYFGGRIQSVALGKNYVPTEADASFFLTTA